MAEPSRFLDFRLVCSSKLQPTAPSVSLLLSPNVPRSQPGVVAAMQARTIDITPNILIVAHTNPAAPLFPSISDSAVEDPMRAVSAVTSTRLPVKLRLAESKVEDMITINLSGIPAKLTVRFEP
jgi:hypothetical protein